MFIRFLVARELLSKFDIEVRVMKFNATFKNISAISWRSGLLVEEARIPGENQRSVASQLTNFFR